MNGTTPTAPRDRQFPAFDELPRSHDGVPTAWHYTEGLESTGRLIHQTPQRITTASHLVRSGRLFPLDIDPTLIDPPLFGRRAARRTTLISRDSTSLDDVVDDYFPQAASQWDALGHIALAHDVFYGGAALDDVVNGERNTISAWARRGIAGRAVVLDVEALWGIAGVEYDPTEPRPITVDMLETCRKTATLDYTTGDVLLLHTGFLPWYRQQPPQHRTDLAADESFPCVGLEHTEAMARYLWESGCSAIATDTPALEIWPPDKSEGNQPWGYLHRVLLGGLGIGIGELWWLADLVSQCRRDRSYEAFLTSTPWHLPGAVGSPANALAIK